VIVFAPTAGVYLQRNIGQERCSRWFKLEALSLW